MFEEIAKAMQTKGYSVTADILDRKMRHMKKTYRGILDNNNKKNFGRGRMNWEYFSIFQDVLQEDKTMNTTPVVDTKIPSQIHIN